MNSNAFTPQSGPPGVYIQEVSGGSRPIFPVGTSTAGIVGISPKSKQNSTAIAAGDLKAEAVDNWTQFRSLHFSATDPAGEPDEWTHLSYAVYGFFLNGGRRCWVVDMGTDDGAAQLKSALDVLATVGEIAILAAPGLTTDAHYAQIKSHMDEQSDRVFIVDPPAGLDTAEKLGQFNPDPVRTKRGFTVMYVPWLKVANPTSAAKAPVIVPPSGHVAGIWARNDAQRGVHKAPANETVHGALGLTCLMSNETQGVLNPKGINAIRYFLNEGYLVWGARTLSSDPEWKYVNVRRLVNMIAESIAESTRWVVFEPGDEFLWSAIRRDVGAFLTDQWRQGALMGSTPEEAFFVKCDAENNPPDSIRQGRVIMDFGVAPMLPAEFIIIRISQYEAGTDVECAI